MDNVAAVQDRVLLATYQQTRLTKVPHFTWNLNHFSCANNFPHTPVACIPLCISSQTVLCANCTQKTVCEKIQRFVILSMNYLWLFSEMDGDPWVIGSWTGCPLWYLSSIKVATALHPMGVSFFPETNSLVPALAFLHKIKVSERKLLTQKVVDITMIESISEELDIISDMSVSNC